MTPAVSEAAQPACSRATITSAWLIDSGKVSGGSIRYGRPLRSEDISTPTICRKLQRAGQPRRERSRRCGEISAYSRSLKSLGSRSP